MATPPDPITHEGEYANNPAAPRNIAFRFGVLQADKIRGFGEFRDSPTNTACAIRPPLTLPGWGHIDAAAGILKTTACERPFGNVRHRAPCEIRTRKPGGPPLRNRRPLESGW